MLRRTINALMAVVLLASALLAAGVVLAQESGPNAPLAPTGEWTRITPGELQWYAFQFDYDEDVDEPVVIRLYAEPYESTVLTVRNQDQIKLWMDEGETEHIGCCTNVDRDANHDGKMDYMQWAGALRESGTYYIVAETAKGVTEPAYYRFVVEGKNLSMLEAAEAAAVEAAAAPEPVMASVPAAEEAPIAFEGMQGSSPFFAMQPVDTWVELKEGQLHWYAFDFDFDEDWTIPAQVKLYAEPGGGAILTLVNAEQARTWELDGELTHFGCCTNVDEDKNDDGVMDYAVWEGQLRSSGRYYIVVEHAKNIDGPVFYRFDMTGEGLRF